MQLFLVSHLRHLLIYFHLTLLNLLYLIDDGKESNIAYKEPAYHKGSIISLILNSPPQKNNPAVGQSALYAWLAHLAI